MRIALAGMSGSGKSHWSSQLAEEGFRRFCCDDLIAEKLADELLEVDGSRMDLGKWMGLPFDPHYHERESKYLASEIEVLKEIIELLSSRERTPGERVVVDTTGSVIHAGTKILSALRELTTVVHLATPPEVRLVMLQNYIIKPRPVLWRGKFRRDPWETDETALARCYPELLAYREALYEAFAHITIPFEVHHGRNHGLGDFLRMVCKIENCLD